MKNDRADLDAVWIGWKILRFLGFSVVRAASQLKVSAGLKTTPSSLRAARVPVAHPVPWPLPTLKSSRAAAVGSMKDPWRFNSTSISGRVGDVPGAASPQVCCSAPSKRGPGGFHSQELELGSCITGLVRVDLVPFWGLFCPTLMCSKNIAVKHQKKHSCPLTPAL